MNCNKIKKLGATKEEIQKAAEQSEILKLNKDKQKIGRKDNKIPKLKIKILRIIQNEEEKKEDGFIYYLPLIIKYEITKEIYKKGKQFENKIKKSFKFKIDYLKSIKTVGFCVLN